MIKRKRTYRKTPEKIYQEALKNQCRTTPDEEAIVAKHPHGAYLYAVYVIGGRWKRAEATIAGEPYAACNYASEVIKGRWEKGEKAIAKSPEQACYYAKYAIEGRWEHGEDAILRGQLHQLAAYVKVLTCTLKEG